jgi:hypothetical protein
MSRDEVQGQVRRRDRFQCQYCGERKGEQYAHIVPETDGGAYAEENLIFLCYSCHNNWQEASKTSPEMKDKLIKISENMRDKVKIDNLLRDIFSWPAGDDAVVRLGGGMTYINNKRILERQGDGLPPYLSLSVDSAGLLHIDAHFDDASAQEFMHIADNVFEVHTVNAWDIVFTRRNIKFEHVDRKMKLEIRQDPNLDLYVSGNMYLNGAYVTITDERIIDENQNSFSNCSMTFRGNELGDARGLLISPNQIAF